MNTTFRLIATALCGLTFAFGAPIVTLHSSNVGIQSINVNYDAVTRTITIEEVWSGVGPGVLEISGLDTSEYTVIKEITNNSGVNWNRLANELLDPAGDNEDVSDPQPYPAFVPAGFSTSNDQDGLTFDQGGSTPRTSNVFASLVVDELTNARDFLDFYNGVLLSGGGGTVTYGLQDTGPNQPFLLLQRPNAFSDVPEPSTYAMVGLGVAALGLWRRKRR
jgi:hypothetical protein